VARREPISDGTQKTISSLFQNETPTCATGTETAGVQES
jgi:hypothetical protein